MNPTEKTIEPCGTMRLELEIAIEANAETVWKSITEEIGQGWPKDFYCVAGSDKLVLEPKPGGRIYEENSNGSGLLWGTVLEINPPKSIAWQGQIMPPWGGPAISMLRLSLEARGDETVLRVTDCLIGNISETLRGELETGWRQIFAHGLKTYVESL